MFFLAEPVGAERILIKKQWVLLITSGRYSSPVMTVLTCRTVSCLFLYFSLPSLYLFLTFPSLSVYVSLSSFSLSVFPQCLSIFTFLCLSLFLSLHRGLFFFSFKCLNLSVCLSFARLYLSLPPSFLCLLSLIPLSISLSLLINFENWNSLLIAALYTRTMGL